MSPSGSPSEWKLPELAEACGVSPRTVRYYVQRGLLPAPQFRGRDTSYGEEHRVRLLAIKKLQEAFLPLDAIERELAGLTLEQVRDVAEGRRNPSSSTGVTPAAPELPHPTVPMWFPPAPSQVPYPDALPSYPLRRGRGRGESYERIVLAPGLELHVSDDASPEVKRLAERILKEAVR